MKNPIIAELRRIRDANAKRHNYDLDAMARELTQLEPWMEKKTYTLHRGKMVPLISLRARRQRRAVRRGLGTKKAKYC